MVVLALADADAAAVGGGGGCGGGFFLAFLDGGASCELPLCELLLGRLFGLPLLAASFVRVILKHARMG